MKKSFLPAILGGVLFIPLFTGCESPQTKPVTVTPSAKADTAADQEPPTPREIIRAAAAQPFTPVAGEGWRSLFDGSSLNGWRMTDFGAIGRVELQQKLMVFWMGGPFTGVNCTNEIPKQNYEITLDAMRVAGDDFFCGLTFPVDDSFASLIVGGWGGSLVGISSIDGADASENETTQTMTFETGRWYRIRLRVTKQKIEAWIGQHKIVNVEREGHKFSLRPGEIKLSKPFGLASWMTSAAYREIKIRNVEGPAEPRQ